MLQGTDENFRIFFLMQFTKELVKHSKGEVFILDHTLKEEKKEFDEKVKEVIKKPEIEKEFKDLSLSVAKHEREIGIRKPLPQISKPQIPQQRIIPQMQRLMIPRIKLPPRLQYLRPIPRKVEIDLGKLNPLIKDFAVRTIECDGPDEEIIVEGGMGRKPTGIVLSKEEIDEVIEKFSRQAKIPVDEGIVRIFVGNLNFLAITSEVVSPKFLIKKVSFTPQFGGIPQGLPR